MKEDNRPKVAVIRSTYRNIAENIEKIFTLLDYRPGKEGFFIKPNLVGAYAPGTGVVTSPCVIEAIVKFIRTAYPGREIIIGEGCAAPGRMDKVVEKAGYRYLLRRYGARFVDLEEAARIPFQWKHGRLMLPEYLQTHEYINVPKLKTHSQTSVTLGMKNQKGLLLRGDKIAFHRRHDLHDSITVLSHLVKPDLNIMDGILSLEGRGPLHLGTPKKNTNILIGSKEIHAADNAAARIMGFSVSEIAHIPVFSGYVEVGEKVSDCIIPFKRCDPSPWVEKNVYCHFDSTLCSLCSLKAIEALKPSLKNLPYVFRLIAAGGLFRRKDILLGNLRGIPPGAENMICIGSCGRRLAEKHGLPIVKGCPPTAGDIQEQFLRFCKQIKRGLKP